jgi:hypothetical protein
MHAVFAGRQKTLGAPTVATRLLTGALAFIVALSVRAVSAEAQTCPEDLATCLGAADQFTVVADRFTLRPERTESVGFPVFVDADVSGSVCTNRATLTGGFFSDVSVGGDVIALEDQGTAVRFGPTTDYYGLRTQGVRITGDLITGGGSLYLEQWAQVHGVVDTTGMHPKLDACRQAMLDMRQAAETLGGLASGEHLGVIVVPTSDQQVVEFSGTGVQVKDAIRITLKGKKSPELGSTLILNVAAAVDSAVLNVSNVLKVGRNSSVLFGGMVPFRAIINVQGPRATILPKSADVEAPLLGPDATLTAKAATDVCSLYGRIVRVRGAAVAPCW